jgi:hypothetical protein
MPPVVIKLKTPSPFSPSSWYDKDRKNPGGREIHHLIPIHDEGKSVSATLLGFWLCLGKFSACWSCSGCQRFLLYPRIVIPHTREQTRQRLVRIILLSYRHVWPTGYPILLSAYRTYDNEHICLRPFRISERIHTYIRIKLSPTGTCKVFPMHLPSKKNLGLWASSYN